MKGTCPQYGAISPQSGAISPQSGGIPPQTGLFLLRQGCFSSNRGVSPQIGVFLLKPGRFLLSMRQLHSRQEPPSLPAGPSAVLPPRLCGGVSADSAPCHLAKVWFVCRRSPKSAPGLVTHWAGSAQSMAGASSGSEGGSTPSASSQQGRGAPSSIPMSAGSPPVTAHPHLTSTSYFRAPGQIRMIYLSVPCSCTAGGR